MDTINFNHIFPDLDSVTLEAIEDLYKHYHRLAWSYKKVHKVFSIREKITSYGGIVLIAAGTVVGGITVNPTVFATVDSFGAELRAISVKGKFSQKADRARMAYIEFEKVINKLKNFRRGLPFNKEELIRETALVKEFIINEAPLIPN